MSSFKELRTQNISNAVIASTFEEQQSAINLTSPALTVINNFTQKTPIRAQYDTTISDALKQVLAEHSDYVLVTDEAQKLIGIVSSADLQSAKITAIAQRLNTTRNEVSLRYIMTPISQLSGVSMQSLSYASIGDALQTMEHQGSMFLLATTTNNEICGLISARQIAKTLHIPLHITPIAHTFSDVLESVEHPH
ncbi:CBS domain-containing protein [uncultured Pseudoalteromonas sp.]|uniref:CBS domain-containing protein n=1 Tax=uncultured Pseudoalteromonas sp. TaxID=114053 RepID=UPI0030C88A2F